MKEIAKGKRHIVILVLLSIAAFQLVFGLELLHPSNINWLFSERSDWGTHYLGWSFYRETSWQFPLGAIDHYMYPLGTNISYTDSIPLLAIILKPFSALLPQHFQYIGAWLLMCQILNSWYSFKILRHYKVGETAAYIMTCFILISPVFIYRQMHPALCAHWLLTGPIYIYLTTNKINFKQKLNHQFLLLSLSCLVTPYLTAVVICFSFLLTIRLYLIDKVITFISTIRFIFQAIAVTVGIWFIMGILTFSNNVDNQSSGFYGLYRMNLNALYNSFGYSKLLPAQPVDSNYQQDALMYLGFGMILLCFCALGFFIYSYRSYKKLRWHKAMLPLLILSVILTMFAMSNTISFNEHVLVTFPIPDKIKLVGEIFRGSGRFFWAVYYLIMFYSFILFSRIPLKKPISIGLLSTFLLIQVYDISLLYKHSTAAFGDYITPLDKEKWDMLFSEFTNIISVLPFQLQLVKNMDYQDISYFALRNNNNVTAGYSARNNGSGITEFTNKTIEDISNGNFPADNLYITNSENLKYFASAFLKGSINILLIDGYYFIYDANKSLKGTLLMSAYDKVKLSEVIKRIQDDGLEQIISMPPSKGTVNYYIENKLVKAHILQINGWAFITNRYDNTGDSIYIYLQNETKIFIKKCQLKERKDITIVNKVKNLDMAGFDCFVLTDNLEKGKYKLTVAVQKADGSWFYSDGSEVNIGQSSQVVPQKLNTAPVLSNDILYGVDVFEHSGTNLKLRGWAAFENTDSNTSQTTILLINGDNFFKSTTMMETRKDVTEARESGINYDSSGFTTDINLSGLPPSKYYIGICIDNPVLGKEKYMVTEKFINVSR